MLVFFELIKVPKDPDSVLLSRRWVQFYNKDLTEEGKYNQVQKFDTEHPSYNRRNVIEFTNAADALPSRTAVPANAGDTTTWVSRDDDCRANTARDPPNSEEEEAGAILLQHGEANPMAGDSDGEMKPPLMNRRIKHRILTCKTQVSR
jgi:hypothetical protein